MTERAPRNQGRPEPAAGGAERRAARPAPTRRSAHPLLRPFPLTVMTLAVFLTVFALLMARMTALPTSPAPAGARAVAFARGAAALRTRTSGAAAPSAAPSGGGASAAGASAPGGSAAAIATRSSGAGRAESHDD